MHCPGMSFLPTEEMILGTSRMIADIAGLEGHSLSDASLRIFLLHQIIPLCQMAVAKFLDLRCLALRAFRTVTRLRSTAKFDPFLSLDCAPALQGKEGIKFCHLSTLTPLTITNCVGVQIYNFHTFIDFVSTSSIQILQLSPNNYDFIGSLDIMARVTEAGHLQFWPSCILLCGKVQEIGIIIGIFKCRLTSAFP